MRHQQQQQPGAARRQRERQPAAAGELRRLFWQRQRRLHPRGRTRRRCQWGAHRRGVLQRQAQSRGGPPPPPQLWAGPAHRQLQVPGVHFCLFWLSSMSLGEACNDDDGDAEHSAGAMLLAALPICHHCACHTMATASFVAPRWLAQQGADGKSGKISGGFHFVLQVIPGPGGDAMDDGGRPVETPRYAAGTPFQHRPLGGIHAAGETPQQ